MGSLKMALILNPDDRGSKLLTTALLQGKLVPFLNSDISGDLTEPQINILSYKAILGKYFPDFMACKKMEGKTLSVDSFIGEEDDKKYLYHAADSKGILNNFIGSCSEVNISTMLQVGEKIFAGVCMEKGPDQFKAPLAYHLLATGKFKDISIDKLSGDLDLSDPMILHNIVNGGGEAQWDAAIASGKLLGMLDNFNHMVPVLSMGARGVVQTEEPLIANLAKNKMADQVLGHLAEKGMLANEHDVYGDGTDRGADADKQKHWKNELDLGFRPYGNSYKMKVKFGRQDDNAAKQDPVEERLVTPLLMYQVVLKGPLVANRLAVDKLVFNLRGPELKDAMDYLAKTDNLIKDMWFRVQVNYLNDKAEAGHEMVEVAYLISAGPKESKYSGKLVYGCMFDNIIDTAVKACQNSPIGVPGASNPDASKNLFAKKVEMSMNPHGEDTYYCLRPFDPKDVVAVDEQFLREHNVTDDMLSQLLGEG